MLSIAPAVADGGYYLESKNYYDAEALGQPIWVGEAAKALGLAGPVDSRSYDRLCQGQLPDGTVMGRGGREKEHYPGWDLTFSAPKSVSIMAMVGGDRRLVEAVNDAARETIAWIEANVACSRFTQDGRTVARPTGNLAVAMFTHDLTRAQEPQLHVHAATMNVTQGPDGSWRSLDGRVFFRHAKEAGLRFQQILALKVRDLGYAIAADTTNGTFEIAGISQTLIEAYSTRSKQITARLEQRGLTSENATAADRQAAALATRTPKETQIDRVALAEGWRQLPAEHGIDLAALSNADNASAGGPHAAYEPRDRMNDDALNAVRTAAQVLAEKQIVFEDVELVDRAAVYALGRADRTALRVAIIHLEKDGYLAAREVDHFDREAGEHIKVQGWTTGDAIAIERQIVESEEESRRAERPIMSARAALRVADRAGSESVHWEREHQMALVGLLTAPNRVLALEGAMDNAANRHVVMAYLEAAATRGMDARIMTPSAAGATAMTALLRRDVTTLAEHLGSLWKARRDRPRSTSMRPGLGRSFARLPAPPPPRQVWLVADAARLRPPAMRDLLVAAAKNGARVVLMDQPGDGPRRDSGSLAMLRDSGMTRLRLPVRRDQDRNELHRAVAALQRHEPFAALDHIEKAGGRIVSLGATSRSIADQNAALLQRQTFIAGHYAGLAPEERAKARVLELTLKGKEALNAAIREQLRANGELSGPELRAQVLVPRPMTATERKLALSYRAGDVVRFGSIHAQAAGRPAIARGEYFTVQSVYPERGQVALRKEDGRDVFWEPQRWGAARASTYRLAERSLAIGERIVWTRRDEGIGVRAQERATIVGIDPESSMISVERNGVVKDVDVTKHRHYDYAYVDTVHARASQRADHVIAHLPVDNARMTNLQALVSIAMQSRQLTIVTENRERLAQAAEDRPGQAQTATDGRREIAAAALDAVRTAADILVERNAVFPHRELSLTAFRQGMGRADVDDIDRAIDTLAATGQLIEQETDVIDPKSGEMVTAKGWTTAAAEHDERMLLAAEQRGRHVFANGPILPKSDAMRIVEVVAGKSASERPWNPEQRLAAVGLLSSPHRVTGLQGLAGTAKTSTVLKTLAGAARGAGHTVSAMAPTTDAALTLGKALETDDSKTVARHLSQVQRVKAAETEKAPVWIVDEASMVSARTMRDLIRSAEQQGAQLYLVFDVLQLGSVGAGRAAGQLIEHGMATFYLDRIVRQAENPRMRDAIYDLIRRAPDRALRLVEAAGGKVMQINDPGRNHQKGEARRHAAMAKEYVGRPSTMRDESIVIDPTRDGVAAVSVAIRQRLIESKELTGRPIQAAVLEDANLTRPERATSTSYKAGQIVRFPQAVTIGKTRIRAGAYLEVAGVAGAEVRLRGEGTEPIRWEPRSQRLRVEVFNPRERELRVGDRIRWTRNIDDIKAVSGRLATVTAVETDKVQIEIEHKRGGRNRLDLIQRDNQHFTYGYAVTAQRAQGATGYPIINAPSWRLNTVNEASIYVELSRTPGAAFLVTDSRHALIRALRERSGRQVASMDYGSDFAGLAEQKVRHMAAERLASQQAIRCANDPSPAKDKSRETGGLSMER